MNPSKPILDAINAAKKSLQIKMFVFSDPDLLKAVIAAHQRGVKVRVMLNAARRSGEDDNEAVRKALEHAGIEVKDSNPDFGITHEKSMVVDEEIAFVKSLNWATKNLTETRDYAITTTHPHGVEEIIACFDADWHRKEFKPGLSAHLIWCPANGRERIAQFIDEAKHTLFVQNERYQDSVIIERLVRARDARRQNPPHGAPAAFAEEGEDHRRRRRPAHHGRRGHQDSQAQAPETARQDAAGRRPARHRRLDQPRARQLRRPARTGHRSARRRHRGAPRTRSPSTTGNTRIRSISRTRACSPISRNTTAARRSWCCEQTTSTRRSTRTSTPGKTRSNRRARAGTGSSRRCSVRRRQA